MLVYHRARIQSMYNGTTNASLQLPQPLLKPWIYQQKSHSDKIYKSTLTYSRIDKIDKKSSIYLFFSFGNNYRVSLVLIFISTCIFLSISATSDLEGHISWALNTQMKSLHDSSLSMVNMLHSLHNSLPVAIIFKKTVWLRNINSEIKTWEETAHPYPQAKIQNPTER